MGKIKTIVKSFLIGMGIYLFFSVQFLLSEKVIASLISIAILWVLAYLLIFKSDKIVNRCFKELSNESQADEKFTIYCMNIFIIFFSLMALITVSDSFIKDIPAILHFPRAVIDSMVYKQWLLTNEYSDIEWLQTFLSVLYTLCLAYLLIRPDHFIKLVRKTERQFNVQL
jgi:hypothetical protein